MAGRFGEAWKEEAARGSRDAWESLVRIEYDELFAWCLPQCGADRDACREAVQAVFLKAVERVERYDPALCGGRPREWLRGLARNEVRRLRLDRRRSRSLEELIEHGDPAALAALARFDDDPYSDAVLDTEEAKWLIAAAMAKMTRKERAMLAMRHVDGFSLRKIATALGASESATDSALRRARDKLAAKLGMLTRRAGRGPSEGRVAI